MAEAEWRPVFHPAGMDNELRVTLEEVAAGRWMAMRALLARTDTAHGWGLWTHRSQVLAAAAAGSDVVETWQAEEPEPRAAVMRARVAVERALRAHRSRHPTTEALWRAAIAACGTATREASGSPVPWICFLALAALDEHQQAGEHHARAADPLLPRGPWGLLRRAHELDPYNREAYHRMLNYWLGRPEAAAVSHADGYARWVLGGTRRAPAAAHLLMLPVYVRVERWLRLPREALDMHWLNSYAIQEALTAFHEWFGGPRPGPGSAERSVQDLSHLAHALWAGQQYREAGEVFLAMGRHATPRPWQHRMTHQGGTQRLGDYIARCRAQCLGVAGFNVSAP